MAWPYWHFKITLMNWHLRFTIMPEAAFYSWPSLVLLRSHVDEKWTCFSALKSEKHRECCVFLFLRLHFPFCVSLFPFLCIYISLEIFLAFLRKSGPQSFLIGKRFVIRWRQWIYAKPPPTTQHKYKYNNKQAHKCRIQIPKCKLEM